MMRHDRNRLFLQDMEVDLFGIPLDLADDDALLRVVDGDQVDFVLAVLLPPVVGDGVVQPRLGVHLAEETLKDGSGIALVVGEDLLLEPLEVAHFDGASVPVNEAEPEVQEIVGDDVLDVLGVLPREVGTSAGYDVVVLLKPVEVSAGLQSRVALDIATGGLAAGEGGKDGEVVPVVLPEFVTQHLLSLSQEVGSEGEDVADDPILGDRPAGHQLLDVFGDSARDHVKAQEILGGVAGIMVGEDGLEGCDVEWPDLEPGGCPAVERFLLVLEDLLHLRIEGSADDEVYVALPLVRVPDVLDVGEDGRPGVGDVLELVEHQREVPSLRDGEDRTQKAGKRGEVPEVLAECLADDFREFGTEERLALLAHEEVHEGNLREGRLDQCRLADTPSSGHDRHLGRSGRQLLYFPERLKLFGPVVELHDLSSFWNPGCCNHGCNSLQRYTFSSKYNRKGGKKQAIIQT